MKKLYNIIEQEKIKLIEDKLFDNINGVFYRNNSEELIILKKNLPKPIRRVVLAEEIGHHFTSSGNIFCQSRESFSFMSRDEYFAKKWAVEFLIPKNKLLWYISHLDGEYLDKYQLAEIFGVTEEAIEFRYNVLINSTE